MFVVADNNPDVTYTITPPTVTDAEGSPVPAGDLTFEITSDNASAVEVAPTDPLSGSVHFGSPNADGSPALANLNVLVKSSDGTVLGSFGAQFTVKAGAAAAIAGGSISFDGLTES